MKILVSAEAFGYGPIATCLNVVKELKKYDDIKMVFIGTGIALEQALMSNYFDETIECKTFDFKELEKFEEFYKTFDVILSSENINGVRFALKIGMKNVYYIDNLMWMWDKLEDGLENLKGYIISETISCRKNFNRIGQKIKRPIFVGPLRDINICNKAEKENKLIISVGGAEAFIIDSDLVKKFYNKLINDVVSNNNLINKFDKIIICGGSGVINNLKLDSTNDKIIVKTLSNQEFLEELKQASHCILASGLGHFIETVWQNQDILYLPPVNYSQLLQLDYYKVIDLGFELINWDKFDFFEKIPSLLNEEVGVNLVLENVKKYIESKENTTIKNLIDDFLNNSQDNYYPKRIKFSEKFKKNSSEEVASIIYNENKEV